MQVLREGHCYLLDNFEDPGKNPQEIQFIEKEQTDTDGTLETVYDGTTNEEVLKMLLDRMRYLNYKMPCRENDMVIGDLQHSLDLLEKRTRDREKRNVEGLHKP